MRLVIEGNTRGIEDFIARLTPERLRQAMSTGVNDTARQVRTRSVREVVKASSIERGAVDKGIVVKPFSTPATLQAVVIGSGKPIELKYFHATQTPKGVRAVVWGKPQFYPHAFISEALGGNVFVREGRARLPIHKMFGAGIAQVMAEDEIRRVLVTYGQQRLEINVLRQLDRAVAGAGGAGR